MTEFNKNNFFMTADGLKSTDAKAKNEVSRASLRTRPIKRKGKREAKFDGEQANQSKAAALRIYINQNITKEAQADPETNSKELRALKVKWDKLSEIE